MTTKRIGAVIVGLLLTAMTATAQRTPAEQAMLNATPTLSEHQKTQLENVQLQVMVTERDFVIAQYKYEVAQKRAAEFIAGLQQAGWDLDVRTQTYKKQATP